MSNEIKIELGDLDLEATLAAAIMHKLDDVKKDQLIETALEYILSPGRHGEKSPLDEAFQMAVRKMTHEVVGKYISEDDRIKDVIRDAFDKVLDVEEHRDKLVGNVADSLIEGFKLEPDY